MPVHENLRTPIQRQASPAASPARRKGARGENQKIAVSRMACPRFIKFIRLLTKPTSDDSCGGVTNGAFGNLLFANAPLSLVCSFSHEIVNNFTGARLCDFRLAA